MSGGGSEPIAAACCRAWWTNREDEVDGECAGPDVGGQGCDGGDEADPRGNSGDGGACLLGTAMAVEPHQCRWQRQRPHFAAVGPAGVEVYRRRQDRVISWYPYR